MPDDQAPPVSLDAEPQQRSLWPMLAINTVLWGLIVLAASAAIHFFG